MTSIRALSNPDRVALHHKLRLAAQYKRNNGIHISIRKGAKIFSVTHSSLQNELKRENTLKKLPGRPPVLTNYEENIVADGVVYFSWNHKLLSREWVKYLIKEFVAKLPAMRQVKIGWKDNRPGTNIFASFSLKISLYRPNTGSKSCPLCCTTSEAVCKGGGRPPLGMFEGS